MVFVHGCRHGCTKGDPPGIGPRVVALVAYGVGCHAFGELVTQVAFDIRCIFARSHYGLQILHRRCAAKCGQPAVDVLLEGGAPLIRAQRIEVIHDDAVYDDGASRPEVSDGLFEEGMDLWIGVAFAERSEYAYAGAAKTFA